MLSKEFTWVLKNGAKCERKKPRWTKPKAPAYEKAVPRPELGDFKKANNAVQSGQYSDSAVIVSIRHA